MGPCPPPWGRGPKGGPSGRSSIRLRKLRAGVCRHMSTHPERSDVCVNLRVVPFASPEARDDTFGADGSPRTHVYVCETHTHPSSRDHTVTQLRNLRKRITYVIRAVVWTNVPTANTIIATLLMERALETELLIKNRAEMRHMDEPTVHPYAAELRKLLRCSATQAGRTFVRPAAPLMQLRCISNAALRFALRWNGCVARSA